MPDKPPPVFVLGCVSCGKTVSGDEKSCPQCGASFGDVKFECPFCGELICPEDLRCPECGTEFAVFAGAVDETSSVELDGPVDTQGEVADDGLADYECPNCGKPVGAEDTVCPNCGARFTEQ